MRIFFGLVRFRWFWFPVAAFPSQPLTWKKILLLGRAARRRCVDVRLDLHILVYEK